VLHAADRQRVHANQTTPSDARAPPARHCQGRTDGALGLRAGFVKPARAYVTPAGARHPEPDRTDRADDRHRRPMPRCDMACGSGREMTMAIADVKGTVTPINGLGLGSGPTCVPAVECLSRTCISMSRSTKPCSIPNRLHPRRPADVHSPPLSVHWLHVNRGSLCTSGTYIVRSDLSGGLSN
jgi:hypothetical protein